MRALIPRMASSLVVTAVAPPESDRWASRTLGPCREGRHRAIVQRRSYRFGGTHVAGSPRRGHAGRMAANEREEMHDRALEALALARARGVPWLATMAGVQAVATGDPSVAELRIGRPGPSGAGLVGVAMLADLALGAA